MAPLSITASTVALATLCLKVSKAVYSFTSDTPNVDSNVDDLCRGLRSLSQVLANVSTAWADNPLVAIAQTGPDGNLWICVKDSICNCGMVLKKLEAVLDKVSSENAVGRGFMRRPVKQIKLNLNKKDILEYGSEVQMYERALGIALNAINTCAAMRRDHTDAEVTKRLQTIESGIQGLSQSLRHRYDNVPVGAPGLPDTRILQQFLKAAETFKSSASTIVNGDTSTVRGGLTSRGGGSIFGDSLSDDRYEIISSWIPPPSPLGTRGPSTVTSNNKQEGLTQEGSLPELMAVLATVTQIADQYRNSEQERLSTKDEQLRSLEMEIRALEQKLEQRQALLANWERVINDKEKTLTDCKQKYDDLHGKYHNLDSLHKSAEFDIIMYKKKTGKVYAERDKLQYESAEKDAAAKQAKEQLEKAIAYCGNLQQQLDEREARIKTVELEQADLRDKFKKQAGQLDKYVRTVDELNRVLKDQTAEVAKQTKDIKVIESRNKDLESEITRSRDESLGLQADIEDCVLKIHSLKKERDLKRELAEEYLETLHQSAQLQQQQSQLLSRYAKPAVHGKDSAIEPQRQQKQQQQQSLTAPQDAPQVVRGEKSMPQLRQQQQREPPVTSSPPVESERPPRKSFSRRSYIKADKSYENSGIMRLKRSSSVVEGKGAFKSTAGNTQVQSGG